MVSYKKRKETSIEVYKTILSLLHDLVCDPNYYGVSIDQYIVPVEHLIVEQYVTEVLD
jgi:hypothetical protein